MTSSSVSAPSDAQEDIQQPSTDARPLLEPDKFNKLPSAKERIVHFDESQIPDSDAQDGKDSEPNGLGTEHEDEGDSALPKLQEIVQESLRDDPSLERRKVLAAYGIVESGEVPMKAKQEQETNGDALPPHTEEEEDSKGPEKETKEKTKMVAYWKLFQYADWLDVLLMTGGTLGAIVHGASIPIFFVFFGNITDTLSSSGGVGSVLQVRFRKVRRIILNRTNLHVL